MTLYAPLIYHWCRRWGLQPRDADNVGQEVFLRVSQRLGQFHREAPGTSFRAWLYRITRNCWIDFLRQKKREVAAAGGSDALEFMQSIPAHESDGDLDEHSEENALLYRRAVELIKSEFSDRDWIAFEQVVLSGRSPAEVAARLDVSVNVIYLAKSRVLRRLRDEFDELLDC